MYSTDAYFNYTNQKDKHFFAGLFNTALNNFNLSLNESAKRINKKGLKKLGLIDYLKGDRITQSDYDNFTNYLSESLVFVKHLVKENRELFSKQLSELYILIDNYRNYYTHFNHNSVNVSSNIFTLLDTFILNSVLSVKKERAKTDENKTYLKTRFADEFEITIEEANTKIKLENDSKPNYKLRKELIKPEDSINFVLNKAFHHFLYKNNKGEAVLKNSAQSRNEDSGNITQNGIIQLLALFLNKKQLEVLFNNSQYLKSTKKLNHLCTRWTFSYLAYRDIKNLFRSDYSNDALILQMLSELTKCPKHLYPNLSDDLKQEFIEDINEYLKDGESSNEIVSHLIVRKRYDDKFAYFAVRFLDEFMKFPTLRFQVNLGKFNHHTTLKNFENTIVYTERHILEKINVFEKLSVVTQKKKEYFKKTDLENSGGWVEFPRPNYQFYGNNIPISFVSTKQKLNKPSERKNNKLSKSDITKQIGLEYALNEPVAFLSFNELPALLYAVLIEKKLGKDIERILLKKIGQQKGALKQFESVNNYNKKLIPKKLKIILTNSGQTINWEKLSNALQKEVDINPIEDIRKYYKKKKEIFEDFSLSEKGKIATWLAYDVKRFVRSSTKKDWKGYQFSEFQALLAHYDIRQVELSNLINHVLKIDLKLDNPFCGINLNKDSLFTFYNNYISRRKEYLRGLLNSLKQREDFPRKIWKKQESEILRGFKEKYFAIKEIDTYKNNLLRMPLNLPRGIFSDNPTAHNKTSKDKVKLAKWFELSSNLNEAQKFYSFNRLYKDDLTLCSIPHFKTMLK